jgi:cysteine desulfurase
MANDTIYLDHAATTAVRPGVADAIVDAMVSSNANASGQHSQARAAKNALELAREEAADLLGADRPLNVIFTAGGTEADNLAVAGVALASDRREVVVSAIEHEAVLRSAESLRRFGYTMKTAMPSSSCVVTPESVAGLVGPDTAVVSVMAANNEIGTVQPIAEISRAVKEIDGSIPVHTDAVQAYVSESITFDSTGADLISLSAHKFGGPKGVGLLAVRNGVKIDPVIHGGGQEAGRRSGTYNVAGIVGMVEAMKLADAEREVFRSRVGSERDAFEDKMVASWPSAVISGSGAPRMVQHSHMHFPGVLAETLLIRLDQAGIAAAAGSACQSGAVEPSHVLVAMGFDTKAAGECIRFTFGWSTPAGEGVDAASRVLAVLEDLA